MPNCTPQEALQALKNGNQRFIAGTTTHAVNNDTIREMAAKNGQTATYGAVITCSDARVPLQLLFDVGIDRIFTIRTAGHVLGDETLGSLYYALQNLGTRLVVVLGHQGCGAVSSAITDDPRANYLIRKLLQPIRPVVRKLTTITPPEKLQEAVEKHHAKGTAKYIRELFQQSDFESLLVVPAHYDLYTGVVTWLED